MIFYDDNLSGYIQKTKKGTLEGELSIYGVDISPVHATMFEKDGDVYLWLRRKDIMEYDFNTMSFKTRKARPKWEVYMRKQVKDGSVCFKGEFVFLRFKYSITGLWDRVLGMEKSRMNLFVDRLPQEKQDIINKINKRMNAC